MTRASLRAGHALWRSRNFEEAANACRLALVANPNDPEALHLMGLIRKDAGDLAEGERLLRLSIALAPSRTEFRANLGNLLLRAGRLQEAVETYRAALAVDSTDRPARFGLARAYAAEGRHAAAASEFRTLLVSDSNDVQAWSALADSLRAAGRFADAEAALRKALTLAPERAVTRHNLGALLSHIGRAEEALLELDRAASLGLERRALIMNRASALLQLYRLDEAEAAYASAVRADPRDTEAQRELAQLRFMRGDPDFARDAAAAAAANRGDPRVQLAVADILRRSGNLQGAESILRDLTGSHDSLAEARAALASLLHQMDRLDEAEIEALAASEARPLDDAVAETLVVIRLALGRPDQVSGLIEAQRVLHPLDQRWMQLRGTAAARLTSSIRSIRISTTTNASLQVYDLDAPRGWASMAELNRALLQALDSRHLFATHPLNQSLRNGSQTARSLLTDTDPAIQAILEAFEAPIADYRQRLGMQAEHPLSARNTGASRIVGAWSVQLRSNGFHVNHIHPQGWISSAYYVAVPDEVDRSRTLKSGWLKFGETRYAVPGATVPSTWYSPARAGSCCSRPTCGTGPIQSSPTHRGPQSRSTPFPP